MNKVLRIKGKLQIRLVLMLISLFFLVCSVPKAHASNIALGIYPPIIQIDALAPSDIQSPLTISNESDTPVYITIGVRPFTQSSSDNGEPEYFTAGQRIGEDPHIFEKMSLFDGTKNTDNITLAPRQKKNIELRIHLPKDEPPGDYYFSITFISKPIATGQSTGTAVAGGVSTNVLLSIGPKDATTGYVKGFSSPLFVDHGPVPFTVHIANTSKHFINPQGTIIVKNMFGQTIGKVNLSSENVLAGTARYLPNDNPSNIQYKISNIKYPTAIWPEKFLLGPYAATLTIALSGEGPLYRRTIYFFALPTQVIVGFLLAIILISVVVVRVKKKLG